MHVQDQLGEKIQYILDGGACDVGIESTIVGFDGDDVIVYRAGGLSIEAIEKIAGRVQVQTHSVSNPKAPGQLKSHYAPRKKVIVGDIPTLLKQYPDSGVLSFSYDHQCTHQYILSSRASIEEAARNLFTALRTLDKLPVNTIVTEFVPNEGLGRAINDRLRRAAAEG
jgi:L-threonylcarbamoyladenylate synthase